MYACKFNCVFSYISSAIKVC